MEYNEKETEALIQFRNQLDGLALTPEHNENHFLVRWLRARNLDLKKAKEMLVNYLDWIGNNKNIPVTPLDWDLPASLKDDLLYKIIGVDNFGRPIVWLPIGRYEVKKHLEQGYKDDCFRWAYKIMDEIIAAIESSRLKTNATQFVGLLDINQLTMRKISFEALRCTLRFFRELEMYYPELICGVYVVNAPYVFSYVYNMVRPIMSSRTIEKVHVFDSNENKWGPFLLENIPREILPQEYGGDGEAVLS